MNRALELDPTSANMMSDLGQIYYFAHEFEKAEEFYRKADAIDESRTGSRWVELYEIQGREY